MALLAALVASFFISNGNGFQIWVLLAFGPMLLRLAQRRGGLARRRRAVPDAPRRAGAQRSPGAGPAGLKRAFTLRQSATRSLGRGTRSRTPAPSVRPKITAAASPPSV